MRSEPMMEDKFLPDGLKTCFGPSKCETVFFLFPNIGKQCPRRDPHYPVSYQNSSVTASVKPLSDHNIAKIFFLHNRAAGTIATKMETPIKNILI